VAPDAAAAPAATGAMRQTARKVLVVESPPRGPIACEESDGDTDHDDNAGAGASDGGEADGTEDGDCIVIGEDLPVKQTARKSTLAMNPSRAQLNACSSESDSSDAEQEFMDDDDGYIVDSDTEIMPAEFDGAYAALLNACRSTGDVAVIKDSIAVVADSSEVDATVAFIEEADKTGYAAIHHASQAGFIDAVAELLESGCYVDLASLMHDDDADEEAIADGSTALHIACHLGNVGLVDLLLKRGANPDRIDGSGRTPAESASEQAEGCTPADAENCEQCARMVSSWASRQLLPECQAVAFASGRQPGLEAQSPVRELGVAIISLICRLLPHPAAPDIADRFASQGWIGEELRTEAFHTALHEPGLLTQRGQGGHAAPLTSRLHRIPAHFLLNLHGI
jgi:hypothetical protein